MIYEAGIISGWDKSLLITTLKRGTIFRTKLNATGTALEDGTYEEFHSSDDRYRDLALDPDGRTIYAITDNFGGTSGPGGTSGVSIQNPGVIVKIEYTGETLGNNSNLKNMFSISPNPTSDNFSVYFSNQNIWQSIHIEIADMHGRIVSGIQNVKHSYFVDISKLSDGVYILNFIDPARKNLVTTKKLVVRR